jgi:hypothetical protein
MDFCITIAPLFGRERDFFPAIFLDIFSWRYKMAEIKIGNHMVGDGHPCYVVAEIGINHNGDLDTAKKLIDVAVAA